MSTILLTNHNENIYNILKKEETKLPPKIAAKSPFIAKLLEAEEKKNKYCHKTFGFAEVPLKKPSEYLKKNSRTLPPCPKIDEPRCLLSERRPPVPPRLQGRKKSDYEEIKHAQNECLCPDATVKEGEAEATQDIEHMSLAGKRTKDGTNYCHKNIVRAVRLAPRQPKRNYIDTKKGDAHPLSTSGLEPHFILSKKYGKLPNYLRERQQEEEAAKKELQTEINLYKPEGRYITQPERKALLAGLKHNWEEVQKAYQLLPILTDTLPKKKHKAKLEEELKQLEHDIRMLERHPHIYVTDASCSVFSYDPDSD